MPPVREASTKPSAATVLPAPVACSNQKRRAAPGSSGCSGSWSSSSARRRARQSPFGSLVLGASHRRPRRRAARRRARSSSSGSSVVLELGRSACAVAVLALGLRDQRGERARQRVDLVGGEHGAVGELRLVVRRAAARGRASASTAGATRRSVPRGRPRSRPAQRRTHAGVRCRASSASMSCGNGSRVNCSTRSRSSRDGMDVALSATSVMLAISRLDS